MEEVCSQRESICNFMGRSLIHTGVGYHTRKEDLDLNLGLEENKETGPG
jgi:hypothetical protein